MKSKKLYSRCGKSSKNKHPQPPAPPRWQESEPKPERSSRENVQTSSSPQRIRSKISVLCARSKWFVAKGRKIDHPQVKRNPVVTAELDKFLVD